MKKLILFLFIFGVNAIIAQNFQNICSPGTTLYKSVSSELKAFRLDSLYPIGNSDTMFISYRTIREDSSWTCLDTTNGSILGRKILKRQNGWFLFFNTDNDTISINTQAALNETWKFCNLPDNGYIQAKVSNVGNEIVLGLTDQVKTITFQAKNSGNVDIPHILNQRDIKLSQHYGLSRMLDVFWIPRDTLIYMLAGKTVPEIGLQDIAWKQIYDFNIGDEFHYSGGEYHPVNYPEMYVNYSFDIYHVLGKTPYGNDSVKYIMEYCHKDTTWSSGLVNKIHDAITVVYNFSQLTNSNSSWFTKLPEEFFNQNNVAFEYKRNFEFNDRQNKYFKTGAYMTTPFFPGCWLYNVQPDCFTIFLSENKYTDGLGCSHYQDDCFNSMTGTHIQSKWNNLVYFKKGSETWGNPVAPDCWVLTDVEDVKTKEKATNIHIVPNPVETTSRIWLDSDFPGEEMTFFLTDYLGKNIARFKTGSQPYFFNSEGIPEGLYILSVFDKNGLLRNRTKLIIL
ncbi:MAG: hypothetical protein NT004_08395 [Bacteroidetes bacterium]|nr:hypothetical protein [Bacteroidota bacterium]